MTPDLFRPEAVAHATRRLSGDVVLAAPLPTRVMGAGLVVLLAGALLFAATGSYARRETVPGWVAPQGGLIRVTAREGGIVEAVHVREGDAVAAAAPLATLRLSTDMAGGDSARAMAVQLKAEGVAVEAQSAAARLKLGAQRAELTERIAILRQQVDETRTRTGLLEQRRTLAESAAARGAVLLKQGFLTKSAMDGLRSTALAAAQDISVAASQLTDLHRQIADLDHELAALPSDLAALNAQAAQSRATLSQRWVGMLAQSTFIATAPIGGRVVALPLEPGQTASPGAAVAVLMPSGSQLTAELYAPSRAVGFIRPGQEVRLMYQAFPYQTFGTGRGVVRSVSRTVLAPSEVAIPGLTVQEPVFRVRVALDRQSVAAYGRLTPLQPGMLLTADVVIDRRTLLQWLLDPLYAAGRRT
jgi:membrane fusion protein